MWWLLGILATTILVVGLIGWLWIVIIAFNNGDMLWAVGCFFIPPLTFVYGLMNYDEAQVPFWIVTVGFGLNILIRVSAIAVGAAAGA